MKLSAPLFYLKRQARLLSRKESIPLHAALDRVAMSEGFRSWSLLAARHGEETPAQRLYDTLVQGDLVLVGARPGHGKTLMSLELAVEAMKAGNRAAFFSLEYVERDMLDRFAAIGVDPRRFEGLFSFDSSDAISADHIVATLGAAASGTLVVIDYLQLLDQRRENPPLSEQMRVLSAFARERGLIVVVVSQIDRRFDASRKTVPDIEDVRLPNPVDLSLFSKTCFLNNGEVRVGRAA